MNLPMKWIQSPENPLIKEIKEIKKQPQDKIFLEGIHTVKTASVSEYIKIKEVFVTEKFLERRKDFLKTLQDKKTLITGISEKIAKTISDTVTPQGIFAVAEFRIRNINDLSIENPSLIVIGDRIQDPGNLGTIIRAGEALGAEAVFLTEGTCNPFSGKVLRASTGSIFFIPVVKTVVKEIEEFLLKNNLTLIIAEPDAEKLSFDVDFTEPVAVALGNEARGISPELKNIPHISCKIPHKGKTESLNVAMTATVFLYEIFRQRILKHDYHRS